MTMPIIAAIDEVEADGQITPDEHGRVMEIFQMARAIANERDEYRTMLERKHDEQFVKSSAVLIGAIATAMFGYLTSQGFDLLQIAIALMTIGGSFIMALGWAHVKQYIPNATKLVKTLKSVIPNPVVAAVVDAIIDNEQPQAPAPITPAPTDSNTSPPVEAPTEAQFNATQPEDPGNH